MIQPRADERRLMRRVARAAAAILAGAALAAAGPISTAQSQPGQVDTAVLTVSSGSVGAGLTTAVTVEVQGVTDLFGGEITLSFDPVVLQAVDAQPGTDGVQFRLGDFLEPGIVAMNAVDNEAGTVEYALTQIRPSEPKSGGGTLLAVEFEGLVERATAEIVIEHATLVTVDVVAIPLTLKHGSVRVVSAMDAPDTPTPAPEVVPAINLPPRGDNRGPVRQPPGDDAPRATDESASTATEPISPGTGDGAPSSPQVGDEPATDEAGKTPGAGDTAGGGDADARTEGLAGARSGGDDGAAAGNELTRDDERATQQANDVRWTVPAGEGGAAANGVGAEAGSDEAPAGPRIGLLLLALAALAALLAWQRVVR